MKFTYTVPVDIDMSGGAFRLVIPSGWTVSKGLVTVSDGETVIYDTIRDGTANSDVEPDGPQEADNDPIPLERGRVKILPVSGSNVSSIEVSLDAGWNAEGTDDKVLTIQFSLVTAPIPSRLPFMTTATDDPRSFEEYQFTATSKKVDGTLTRLKPPVDENDNPTDENPQPFARVGNAASGTGTAPVTPTDVYEKESGRDFRITYTAAGPMYNSIIRINVPDALIPDEAADAPANTIENDTDDQAGGAADEAYFIRTHTTVSQRGGVDFGQMSETDRRSVVHTGENDAGGTIDIYIDSMGKGDQVRVFYEDITVEAVTSNIDPLIYEVFTVQTDTDESGFDDLDFTTPAGVGQVGDPAGKVHPLLGSGKVTIEPSAVEINVTRDFTVTYTAPTKLENVWLIVELPADAAFKDEEGDAITTLTTTRIVEAGPEEGTRNYGYLPDDADIQTFNDPPTAVFWKIASISKGSTFRRTIKRLRVTEDAGVYQWGVYLATETPKRHCANRHG